MSKDRRLRLEIKSVASGRKTPAIHFRAKTSCKHRGVSGVLWPHANCPEQFWKRPGTAAPDWASLRAFGWHEGPARTFEKIIGWRNLGLKVRPCYYLLHITHVVHNPSSSASRHTHPNHPAARDYAQHDIICREAASWHAHMLGCSPAPEDSSRQCARQLAGILHANQKHSAELGTKLGAAGRPGPDPKALTVAA